MLYLYYYIEIVTIVLTFNGTPLQVLLYCAVVMILIFPFDIFYLSSRYYLLRTLWRIVLPLQASFFFWVILFSSFYDVCVFSSYWWIVSSLLFSIAFERICRSTKIHISLESFEFPCVSLLIEGPWPSKGKLTASTKIRLFFTFFSFNLITLANFYFLTWYFVLRGLVTLWSSAFM